jgi:hypothetical protein
MDYHLEKHIYGMLVAAIKGTDCEDKASFTELINLAHDLAKNVKSGANRLDDMDTVYLRDVLNQNLTEEEEC